MDTDSPYQYFSIGELSCHGVDCCGGQHSMIPEFMVKLVAMRRSLGFPLTITSAYRCPLWNSTVSHTGESGPHVSGKAVDILCSFDRASAILEYVYKSGEFKGVGIRQNGDVKKRIIHLDDVTGPRRLWTY